MSPIFSSDKRLEILRLTDFERRWYSVDDKRFCVICERLISGRDIRIFGEPGNYSLGCPTEDCPGNFSHWLLYRPTSIRPKAAARDGKDGADGVHGVDGADGADGVDGKREIDFFSDIGLPGPPGM